MTSSQVQANETPPMSTGDIENLRDENGLIDGKFKTVEDMVKSYKELEGKLGDIERTKEEPVDKLVFHSYKLYITHDSDS